jgi:hypothetical protein
MTILFNIDKGVLKKLFTSKTIMSHKMFLFSHETNPLGYLISTRNALCVLLAHKVRDSRLQLFVIKWTGALLAVLGAGIFDFYFVPVLLAVGVIAQGACLFALLLWLGAGDMFLKFALEDERFYDLATASHALSVFEDTEFSLPQPRN